MLAFAAVGIPRFFRSRLTSHFTTTCKGRQVIGRCQISACAGSRMDQVKKIANLAQLEFSEEELHEIAPEFDKVISFFDEMNELDVDDVQPMLWPHDVRNITRDDKPVMFENVDSMLNEAPQVERDYIRVPKISSESTE